jgi:two-component system response regulator CpxR
VKTILLVEDDEDIRSVFAEVLRLDGYAVEEAENGLVALDKLLGQPEPDLVLLDMMMPVMTGAELLDAVGRIHRLTCIPVVVLSASLPLRDDQLRGARRFIPKPMSLAVLKGVVVEFCGPA